MKVTKVMKVIKDFCVVIGAKKEETIASLP